MNKKLFLTLTIVLTLALLAVAGCTSTQSSSGTCPVPVPATGQHAAVSFDATPVQHAAVNGVSLGYREFGCR